MRLQLKSHLKPDRVLYEFERPLMFTTSDSDGAMLLAYCCGEDEESNSNHYLLVPFDEGRVSDLTEGRMTVLEALSQPWAWLATGALDRVNSLVPCSLDSLPDGACLPEHSVMLWPSLEPFLSYRMIGPSIVKGSIPGRVVETGIKAPMYTLQALINHVKTSLSDIEDSLKWMLDVKVQRITYASFDVGFKVEAPKVPRGRDPIPEMKRLLSAGLTAASRANEFRALTDDFATEEEGRSILTAVRALTPPTTGFIEATQIGGRLIQGGRVVGLTRASRRYIGNKLDASRVRRGSVRRYVGTIRAHDLDSQRFSLRDVVGREGEIICQYAGDLQADVLELVHKEARVEVEILEREDGVNRVMGAIREVQARRR